MNRLLFLLAVCVLCIPITADAKYERKEWRHWIDEDKDCRDTRQEVLIRDALPETIKLSKNGCRVITGLWYSPYDDKIIDNPRKIDIDHYVPLKEVYDSGGRHWSKARKKLYANALHDSSVLIAVSARSNRSKGAKDPSEWMPPNEKYHCEYIRRWKLVKTQWQMTYDIKEKEFIDGFNC